MSEATETTMNRRKLLEAVGVAAAAAAASGLAKPAQAAETPAPVPFKWTVAGKFDFFVIPFDPPVGSGRMILKGQSDVLGGEITMTDMHTGHLDNAGNLNRSTDGMAVLAGPGGDAIFAHWSGVARPDPATGIIFRGGFTVKGGRGRYAGATGSGTFDSVPDLAKSEVTQVWEGVIVPCK
jgi:hypothetical protein